MRNKLLLLALAGLTGAAIIFFAAAQNTDTQGSDISTYNPSEQNKEADTQNSAIYNKSTGEIELDKTSGVILEDETQPSSAQPSDQEG